MDMIQEAGGSLLQYYVYIFLLQTNSCLSFALCFQIVGILKSLLIRTKCLLNFYILFRWLSINNNLYNNNIQKENPQKETYTRDIQQKEKEMNYSLSR